MDFSLSEEQRLLQAEVRRFAAETLCGDVEARDKAGAFPRELWEQAAGMQLQGLCVPEEHGGAGLSALDTALALEALGQGCTDGGLVFALCAHLLACVVPIWKHGSPAQHGRWLPGLCDGSRIAVNGMTEPGSGSDAFAMATRAVRDGDGYRLTGTKTFSSNGPVADLAVVYAITDPDKALGGVSAFVVEAGTPGFSAGQQFDKLGLRTCSIGELVLEDCFVPEDCRLGGEGAGMQIFNQSMEWERICLVASHVGTMQRLLDQAVEHARTREAFGSTIGKHQAVSHRLADMKLRLETSRLLVYRSAWRLGRSRESALDAALTKLHASESLLASALDTVRTLGGGGFMAEGEASRALRDAVGGTLYSGTNDIQRNIIAAWLGL